MSILETFYILFKSDASEVKKGAEEAEKSTKHLEESLKNVDNTSRKVGQSFLTMAKSFAGVISAVVSTTAIIAGIREATHYTAELGKVSRELQVNISDLDAWGNAVERSGGSAAAFQGSLKGLAEKLGTTGDVALQALPKFADSFSKLSQVRALQYGKTLGLDENTILLLQKGRREVEAIIAQQKALGVVNKQDAEHIKKFNEALHDAGVASRSFFMELISPAIPYFTAFIKYFIEHKDLVIGGLIAIAAGAALLAAPFVAANAVVIATTAGIAALIAIFAIAFEDIKAFMQGNESLIGDLLKRWPMAGEVLKTVFHGIAEGVHALFHPLETLQNLLNKVWSRITGIFGHNKELTVNINEGQNQLQAAGKSSIRSFNSSTFSNPTAKTNTVNVNGPISVNTQATDANGIAAGIGRGLNDQLSQLNSHVDDGVAR